MGNDPPAAGYTPLVKESRVLPYKQSLDGTWEASPEYLAHDAPESRQRPAPVASWRWLPLRVPGHWQLHPDLTSHEGTVLYHRRFEAQAVSDGETAVLGFGGVYYSAEVWINETYLGGHEGYFSPFWLDCGHALRDGENEILVEVHSPREPEENDRRTVGGVWAMWDGMDPEINPGGIFRHVELVRGEGAHLLHTSVEAHPSGRCRVFLSLWTHDSREILVDGEIVPLGFEALGARFRRKAVAAAGHRELVVEFDLPEPRLWWPRGRGEQPLYELRVRCEGFEEQVRFGVRSVELTGWHSRINGKRLFLRGVNYLPTDAYPARTTDALLREDARLLVDLNLNAVRVHAHVAEDAFYEACDELGILVLQDFPLQWTQRRRVLKPAVAQAGEMARLLRHHPSVFLYLAHDEPFYVAPPEKWSLVGLARTAIEATLPRWALWQRRVLDTAVVGAFNEEDPTRPVIEAAGHPLTTNHLYFGWYYGGFRDLERAVSLLRGLSRLPTEYGAQALPDPESLEEIWASGEEPDWQRLSSRHRLQRQRMERYAPYRGDRLRYVRDTQRYQVEVLRHATELFRRHKYHPAGGTFAFMLNDPAPAVSWSVMDWRRRPKEGYAALAAAMRPVLICARYPRRHYRAGALINLPVWLVNDLPRALGTVPWGWSLEISGQSISSGSGKSEVGGDCVVRLGEVTMRPRTVGEAVLRLWFTYGEGAEHSEESESSYSFLVR